MHTIHLLNLNPRTTYYQDRNLMHLQLFMLFYQLLNEQLRDNLIPYSLFVHVHFTKQNLPSDSGPPKDLPKDYRIKREIPPQLYYSFMLPPRVEFITV